jgi:hypothetical protein
MPVKMLWEDFLELRICLQRAMNDANKLPQRAAFALFTRPEFILDSDRKLSEKKAEAVRRSCAANFAGMAGAAAELKLLLRDLVSLRAELISQHPEVRASAVSVRGIAPAVPSASGGGKKRRSIDSALEGLGNEIDLQPDSSTVTYWCAIEAQHAQFKPFRDATVDRWNLKTQVNGQLFFASY